MAPLPLIILAVLAAPGEADGVVLPAQTRGDMTAQLTIHVADAGAQPGAAHIQYTLTITGGPLLEVERPRLSDPVKAWEAARNDSCLREDGRLVWTEVIQLHQVKPGPAALPDVKARFRDDPAGLYQEAEWIDLLKKAREAPAPETPPLAARVQWQAWIRMASVVLMVIVVGVFLLRRWTRRGQVLSPDQRALRELARLQQTPSSTLTTSDCHSLLSDVIRHYLAERYSLPALRQTTAEFLERVDATGRLSAEQQALLRVILERCDLAKFAPVGVAPEEWREATALAQTFVEQTAGAHLSALAH